MIQLLTYTHIFAGIISLIVAPVAMVVHKGGRAHRLWGKIFFIAMTWIFISAVIISIYKWIPFLLMIAVFSYYAAFTGYRTLYMKQLHLGKGPRVYDWAVLVLSSFFHIAFVGWGIFLLVRGNGGFFPWLAVAFGAGGLYLNVKELRSYLTPPEKHHWLYNHIGRMTGGFIASVTAFSAQVMTFMPGALQWLWPSMVGVPLIIFWIRRYRGRIAAGARVTDLVELKQKK